MAFEKTGFITNIEDKGEYIVATVLVEGEEERKQTVRGEWVAVFKQANEEGRLCNWTLEKREGWKTWNVTKASLAELNIASAGTQRETAEEGVKDLGEKKGNPVPHNRSREEDIRYIRSIIEIGEWLRLSYEGTSLSDILGKENALEAMRWYRGQVLGNGAIPHDGSKFPFIK